MVSEEVRHIPDPIGHLCLKNPSCMRMPQTANHAPKAVAMKIGGMDVAFAVGIGVVPAMVRYPVDDRALSRHTSQNDQHGANKTAGPEGMMRTISMEADADAQTCADIQEKEHPELHHGYVCGPTHGDGCQKTQG